jgi:cell division protein ZapA
VSEPVNVRILDREFTVGCEPGERDSLMAAATLLDARMREIRGAHKMASIDRVAVLAALNLAHELQQMRAESGTGDDAIGRALGEVNRKLDGLFDSLASR